MRPKQQPKITALSTKTWRKKCVTLKAAEGTKNANAITFSACDILAVGKINVYTTL